MSELKIANYNIGKDYLPFIVAEMSGNHNQSLERALEIVDAAADAGVQAIKLQTYTADTMTMKGVHTINDENSVWNGRGLYELYQEAHTPWEWHEPIFKRAAENGILAFSSPFDETAVDFLETLNVPVYKIASFENTDWPLLQKVASTGKPVIVSTGASHLSDISEAVDVLRESGCENIVLLKCTSTYPANPENSNLLTIPHMSQLFNCHVGLSDHTMGLGVAIASIALGARVIEKHFTLRRSDGGVDSTFSLEPSELKLLVEEAKRSFYALGNISYKIQKKEERSRIFKRSIYTSDNIKEGETYTKDNIKIIRPGDGLSPKYFNYLLGKKAKQNLKPGTPLNWDLI